MGQKFYLDWWCS